LNITASQNHKYINYKMGEITFISGGSRSGKSSYAVKLAKEKTKKVLFIATAAALDKEMRLRIKLHKKSRPARWKTIEEPENLSLLAKDLSGAFDLVIIDCLTLFISNLLLKGHSDKYIEKEVNSALKIFKKRDFDTILVTNEVGWGIVPENPLARRFRDLAGRVNQNAAGISDKAFLMISGIPLRIK